MTKRGKVKFKEGQITIYIIIAIIIVGVIVLLFLFRGNLFSGERIFGLSNKDINNVNNYMQGCVSARSEDAVMLIGLQGGYSTLPSGYLSTNISNIAYGFYNGQKTLASKDTIEKQIASYVDSTVPYCIAPEDFPDMNISLGKSKSSVTIYDDSVYIDSKLPIAVMIKGKSFTINGDYNYEVPVKLGRIYAVASSIIDKEISDPGNIQLSYLTNSGYYVLVIPYSDKQIVYSITDNRSLVRNIPYSFVFANKFNK